MGNLYNWVLTHVIGRIHGPLNFRLLLQPTMAVIFAVRHGLTDARARRAPYFWAIFTEPERRKELIREGWKSIGKIFYFAILMDLIYQYLIPGSLYPLAALFVAFMLAFVPYLLTRGLVNRVARHNSES